MIRLNCSEPPVYVISYQFKNPLKGIANIVHSSITFDHYYMAINYLENLLTDPNVTEVKINKEKR